LRVSIVIHIRFVRLGLDFGQGALVGLGGCGMGSSETENGSQVAASVSARAVYEPRAAGTTLRSRTAQPPAQLAALPSTANARTDLEAH
jgi:hypothetical protein